MQMLFFDPPDMVGVGEIGEASEHDGKPIVFIGWRVAKEVEESGEWRLTLSIDAAKAVIESLQAAINAEEWVTKVEQ